MVVLGWSALLFGVAFRAFRREAIPVNVAAMETPRNWFSAQSTAFAALAIAALAIAVRLVVGLTHPGLSRGRLAQMQLVRKLIGKAAMSDDVPVG